MRKADIAMPPQPPDTSTGQAATLPRLQEELSVTTRVVDTGRGVRVSKVVDEHPEQVSVPLWHEELSVERVAVDLDLPEPPVPRYEGDTLVMPVVEEVVVLQKRYRVKEELRITRTRVQRQHTETVTLRSEEVVVERFDNQPDRKGNEP
jgi:uncharacterized protein (TIGR02271 family)